MLTQLQEGLRLDAPPHHTIADNVNGLGRISEGGTAFRLLPLLRTQDENVVSGLNEPPKIQSLLRRRQAYSLRSTNMSVQLVSSSSYTSSRYSVELGGRTTLEDTFSSLRHNGL